ncbi:2420_t:CDS:2 [Diversispora eburnea]|uniref:2420_t:CDS:1 n=1 Tax=Diversispora eburnea TaxID=1213867 RepID=A0A9N9BKZ5_9GLOM|nr:2420_t:CDS:2 [Diversispora eburnea]
MTMFKGIRCLSHLSFRTMTTQAKESSILKWASDDGEFRRKSSNFRNHIKKDLNADFTSEKDRYHLFVSWACPWAHRTIIVRALKGLENVIGLSVVDYFLGEKGWSFTPPVEIPGSSEKAQHLSDIYFKANSHYEGSEIIRMLNDVFDDFIPEEKKGLTFYPENLRSQIDDINEWVYDTVNNGVYKCGFATTQAAYDKNITPLFNSLDKLEEILSKNKFLVGNILTEADIRLWTTIIRHKQINPTGIVPIRNGPGQKKLIALARALIRKSNLIIIDEAMASVDFKTDGLIQGIICQEFSDAILLCIAHRLRTVVDYDMILERSTLNLVAEPIRPSL